MISFFLSFFLISVTVGTMHENTIFHCLDSKPMLLSDLPIFSAKWALMKKIITNQNISRKIYKQEPRSDNLMIFVVSFSLCTEKWIHHNHLQLAWPMESQ